VWFFRFCSQVAGVDVPWENFEAEGRRFALDAVVFF
jgi:hypothetical protein